MTAQQETLYRLQNLRAQREQLQELEEALQTLTPEERLVTQMLLMSPQKGNADRLCELLDRERSSIYRYRRQILSKLSRILYTPSSEGVPQRGGGG